MTKVVVGVPANSVAKLVLPGGDASLVTECGLPLSRVKGARVLDTGGGQIAVGLEPGRYEFEVPR